MVVRAANTFWHPIRASGFILALLVVPLLSLTNNTKADFASGDSDGGGDGGSNCSGHTLYYPATGCEEYWIYMTRDRAVGSHGIWGKIGGTYHRGSLEITTAALQNFKNMLDNACSFADGYFIYNISSEIGRGYDPSAKLAIYKHLYNSDGSNSASLTSFDPSGDYNLVSNTIYRSSSVKAAFDKAIADNGVTGVTWGSTAWFCYERTSQQYLLTTEADPAGGGSATGGGNFSDDDWPQVGAWKNTGWDFDYWSSSRAADDVDHKDNLFYYDMPAQDVTLTAHFKRSKYTLTVVADPSAAVTSISGGGTYLDTDWPDVSFTKKKGYRFTNWTSSRSADNTGAMDDNFSYDMPAEPVTLTAHFVVTADVEPQSSVDKTAVEPNDAGDLPNFSHGISVENFTSNFTANYQVRQKVYDSNTSPETGWPTTGYTNISIGAGSVSVTSRGHTSIGVDALTVAETSVSIGSQICQYLYITDAGTATVSNNPSMACARIIARPIVKFKGLDVNFCNAGGGSVYTWARKNNAETAYIGSSSQYALFVYDQINGNGIDDKKGFFSGATSNSTNPKRLTFANTSGTFGADWGDTGACTDYFAEEYYALPSPPAAGDLTISSDTIDIGEHKTTYVNGDAFINGNITYASDWGTERSNIPSYRLIVSGNIYISPSVTQLDGFYFATGNIYTCSSDGSFPGYSSCTGTLKVYGAFEALGNIKYWRTGGTLATNIPAEEFIFSPEMLLSRWMGGDAPSITDNGIDSIKSLPPVF